MELYNLVAIMIAAIYVPLGVAMLVGQIKGKELVSSFERSPGLQLLIGSLAVIIGVTFVFTGKRWVMDWPVILNIIGWMALIEGILLLAFPKSMFKMTKVLSKNEKLWGIITLILGFLFAYIGFIT